MSKFKESDLPFVFIFGVTLIVMLGSLYFSEIMKYDPCKLCWLQRIPMYSMVIISMVGFLKKDYNLFLNTFILSVIGFSISTYHYLIQKLPAMAEQGTSCGIVPCNGSYINYFGFVTIPFLAGTAFLIVLIISSIMLFNNKKD